MLGARMPASNANGSDVLACLRALSIVLDLANGLREDKSLATALFAHALALRLGLDESARAAAFFAALLRHVGCTSYAHREAILVEDDVVMRRALATADSSRAEDIARVIALANPSLAPDAAIATLGERAPEERIAWASEACGGARMLASSMGFGGVVCGALDEVFERWDGRGVPRALEAGAISICGRLSTVAHVTLAFHTLRGAGAAREVLDAGPSGCDPALVRLARDVLDEHPDALLAGADDRLAAIAPDLARHAPPADVLRIAEAFGDFSDLQSRHTRGHARGVAAIVADGASTLGLTDVERSSVLLAAHLHDVGVAAVPTRIWETRDGWSEGARERARMHVYYTERALVLAPPLARAAAIAGAHHERLDAHGYHRGLGAERIAVTARLLAAADVFHALREDRPHRAALTRTEAKDVLAGLARDGALDARVVDAIAGRPRRARATDSLARLTAREREVLRFVALGRTNKEIAVALGISDRTVQTHTLNVYEKLGVDTRAAAAIVASRAGLLEPE